MSKGLISVVDADYIKHTAAAAGERRAVRIVHRASGTVREFASRTEFYGHWAKKSGGWLAEENKTRDSPYTIDEFDYEDVQYPEPIENVLHTTKLMWEGCGAAVGTKKYQGFLGEGEGFRVARSTIEEYKGKRKDLIKPVHLGEVHDYLEKRFKCEIVRGIETDDRVVQECYKQYHKIITGVDKDYYGQPVNFMNMNRVDEGIQNGDQFGKLWLTEKNDVRGIGRMFLYFQVAFGDDSDCYHANSGTPTKWGEKSAYKALVDATDDRSALEKLIGVYKNLYPEPTTIEGWRKDQINIDWLYMLKENFDMARMLRFDGDNVDIEDVLKRMKIEY